MFLTPVDLPRSLPRVESRLPSANRGNGSWKYGVGKEGSDDVTGPTGVVPWGGGTGMTPRTEGTRRGV